MQHRLLGQQFVPANNKLSLAVHLWMESVGNRWSEVGFHNEENWVAQMITETVIGLVALNFLLNGPTDETSVVLQVMASHLSGTNLLLWFRLIHVDKRASDDKFAQKYKRSKIAVLKACTIFPCAMCYARW